MIKEFNSLNELEESLKTEEDCIWHFAEIRWPEGATCPHCGSMSVYELSKAGQYKCAERECSKKFGVRYGTIFADAKIPLRTWFKAIFLMTSHKKGIASHQLARHLGITQKSAWHMLHRVREAAMAPEFQRRPLLTGTIETDETFVGGKERFKHASKKAKFVGGSWPDNKTAVFGMISHSGELRLQKIERVNAEEVKNIIIHNVRGGSVIHTDEATHFRWMRHRYEHSLVKHCLGQYVKDGVTTNRIEGVFSHFKRSVTGVYHKVSDEHIDRYLGMFSWRWTRRKMGEGERVNALLKATKGHQLTYRKLTRKDGAE